MSGYDLHVHSTWSDGRHSVTELAQMALAAGLDGFALTDHDTVDGWDDCRAVAADSGLDILRGIEISAEGRGADVHILVYGMETPSDDFLALLRRLSDARRSRVEQIAAKLRAAGMAVETEEILARAGDGVAGRPHAGQVLMDKGYVASMQEAFDKYLARGCSCYVPRAKIEPMEAVRLARDSGGLPVLAHPGLDKAGHWLALLQKAGLAGLEVYHPHHSPEQERHYHRAARRNGLMITGGSDFHGGRDSAHGSIGAKRLEVLPPLLAERIRRG